MSTIATSAEDTHAEDDRIFSDVEAERIIDRVISFSNKTDRLDVTVQSVWFGRQRWARNRAFLTSTVRRVDVRIELWFAHGPGGPIYDTVQLNQVDDTSLRNACRYLEENRAMRYRPGWVPSNDFAIPHPVWESKGIPVWSDVSYNRTATENAQVVSQLITRAEAKGMLASGSIETAGAHYMGYFRDWWGREDREKGRATMAECSSTVRHPKGVGSGWAGASSFDLQRIDLAKLGETAFEKCMRSIDPVRIEPGRYQTILEPPAVATFAQKFFMLFQDRDEAEERGPFFLGFDNGIQRGRSKAGLQIADRRLNISHNPEDPISGTHPNPGMRTIDYLKDGIITEMGRNYAYSLPNLARGDDIPVRDSFVMRGSETTTVDEMILSMKRGLLLTRVSGETTLDEVSALYTGVTRDGLWLIENGKITKAVRNFRWTESPLFVFNNIESIGESVPVMTGWYDAFPFLPHALQRSVASPVVPTLKVNDFSFTSTIDAV